MINNATHHRSTLLVIRNHVFDGGILKNVFLYHKSSKKDLDKIPLLFLKSQSFLLNELVEHLIIKGKNTFACLYACLHSKICNNTLYYMSFFEILQKELNTQKFMTLLPMWSFCNSSRCARTNSHTKTEICTSIHMHKHTHTNAHSHKHAHIHTQLFCYS